MNQCERLRPCGRLETYSTTRHHLGFYNNVGLTATYTTLSTQTKSLEQVVFTALHHVIAKHPNLSAIPREEDKSYPEVYFARLPEIDLTTCVEFHTRSSPIPQGDEHDSELDQLLQSQHSRSFKGNVPRRPYWWLAITSYPSDPRHLTASWIFHHALSDGASSPLFHSTFLEGLNDTSVSPQLNINPLVSTQRLVSTPSAQLAPPLEDLHSMSMSWSFFLRAVAGSLLPGYFAPRPQGLWTGSCLAREAVSSHTTTVVISSETTRAFAAECRRQETSVTAALSTLLSAALFHLVDMPHDKIKIDTPISLRPFLDVQDKTMLNAITNHTSTFHRTPATTDQTSSKTRNGFLSTQFLWDTARRVKSSLSHEVAKKGADNPIALLKYVKNMHEYFVGKVGGQRESTAEVSNLGVYRPFPSNSSPGDNENVTVCGKEQWKIGRMIFSQSLNHTGPMVSLSAVTGGDGCLVLSFNWPRQPVEHAEGAERELWKVPEMMKRGVEELVRPEKST